MNQKLKDLAFRAGFVGESMYPIFGTSQETALATFAELIIKECADAGDEAHAAHCPYVGDYIVESMDCGDNLGAASWRCQEEQPVVIMKNPAIGNNDDVWDEYSFNEFTTYLLDEISQGRTPLVKLRNGTVVPVSRNSPPGVEYEHFECNTPTATYIWEDNGISVASTQYDMVELYNQ